MTLIASFLIKGIPVLIGDALISAPNEPQTEVLLPLHTSPFSPVSVSNGYIVDIQQKVHLIGSNIVLAWSGVRIAGKSVALELEEITASSDDIVADFDKYFADLSHNPEGRMISLIATVIVDRQIFRFHHDVTILNSPTFGEVHISGTGAGELISILSAREGEDQFYPRDGHHFEDVELATHCVIDDLLVSEYMTKENLEYGYGGAYELAIYNKSKFEKIGDKCFYFGQMIFDKEESNNTMHVFSKYDYVGDLLRIRTEDWRTGERIGRLNLVRPITKEEYDYSSEEMAKLVHDEMDYNSTWQALHINARFLSGGIEAEYKGNNFRMNKDHLIIFDPTNPESLFKTSEELQYIIRKELHDGNARYLMNRTLSQTGNFHRVPAKP